MIKPAAVAALPHHGEYPIPFTTAVIDGKPDFRVNDLQQVARALRFRLCGLCGRPHGYYICFVGGPSCVAERKYVDVPMHEECARYAASVCPFLLGGRGYSTRTVDPAVIRDGRVSTKSPTEIIMYVTRSYKVHQTRTSWPKIGYEIRPAPAVRTEVLRGAEC